MRLQGSTTPDTYYQRDDENLLIRVMKEMLGRSRVGNLSTFAAANGINPVLFEDIFNRDEVAAFNVLEVVFEKCFPEFNEMLRDFIKNNPRNNISEAEYARRVSVYGGHSLKHRVEDEREKVMSLSPEERNQRRLQIRKFNRKFGRNRDD